MKRLSVLMFALIATIAAQFVMPSAIAGTPIYVGQKTPGKTAIGEIDHSSWNTLLQKYVDEDGFVAYRSWHASRADQMKLTLYLNSLSLANPRASATKDAKLAFWINAYNAVTIYGILQQYPTSSIRNHTARVFGYNIWHDLQLYVQGKAYSLHHVEHQILRKMNEPRIHFAIVCASIGCPRLVNQAYTPAKTQKILESNAKDFFRRPRNFRHDVSRQTFQMSAILDWFAEDFGRDRRSQLKTIAKWLPNATSQAAARQGEVRVSYLDYNWNLNDQSARR